MKFLGGPSNLESITGGTLLSGSVPLDRIVRGGKAAVTTGTVNITTLTTIVTATVSVSANAGDYLLMEAYVGCSPAGAVPSDISYNVQNAGTAVYRDGDGLGPPPVTWANEYQVAVGNIFRATLFRILPIQTGGTVIWNLRGSASGASGGNVVIDEGFLRLLLLKGATG